MIEGRPSQTALHVAAARAGHLRFDPEPHLLEDRLAALLLGDEREALIDAYHDGATQVLLENRIFVPLRARYAEDRLVQAHARGARQFVLLGAGLDSFGFRPPAGLEDVVVYEVDHPSTQSWKFDRIEQLGWAIPENLRRVACDFERHPVSEVLLEAGFDPACQTVISWMGVVYYLEPATMARALVDLHAILAPGSEIVLDSMRPWDELSARYDGLRETMTKYLETAGEPQVNRLSREQLERVILDAGYAAVWTEPRSSIEARYLAPIGTSIPLSERFRLAVATR